MPLFGGLRMQRMTSSQQESCCLVSQKREWLSPIYGWSGGRRRMHLGESYRDRSQQICI